MMIDITVDFHSGARERVLSVNGSFIQPTCVPLCFYVSLVSLFLGVSLGQ